MLFDFGKWHANWKNLSQKSKLFLLVLPNMYIYCTPSGLLMQKEKFVKLLDGLHNSLRIDIGAYRVRFTYCTCTCTCTFERLLVTDIEAKPQSKTVAKSIKFSHYPKI